MDYIDTGVIKEAIGNPTDEERERLIREGYTSFAKRRYAYEPFEEYEIWVK